MPLVMHSWMLEVEVRRPALNLGLVGVEIFSQSTAMTEPYYPLRGMSRTEAAAHVCLR
jgi:hypothetical protein